MSWVLGTKGRTRIAATECLLIHSALSVCVSSSAHSHRHKGEGKGGWRYCRCCCCHRCCSHCHQMPHGASNNRKQNTYTTRATHAHPLGGIEAHQPPPHGAHSVSAFPRLGRRSDEVLEEALLVLLVPRKKHGVVGAAAQDVGRKHHGAVGLRHARGGLRKMMQKVKKI